LKDDSLFPHLDRPQSCVREDRYARRHGRRETEIICGGQAVDDDATLVSPRDCIYDRSNVGCCGLAGQSICARAVVQATADPGQLPVGGEALQRLVDGGAGTEIQKIDGRPHLARLIRDSTVDMRSEIQPRTANHLSEL
jgi:hypothetical protein